MTGSCPTRTPSIHHANCTISIQGDVHCSSCKDHRKSLHAMLCRSDKMQLNEYRTAPDSHVHYSCLTLTETKERLSCLHQEVRSTKEDIAALTAKLEKFADNCTASVDAQTHHDLLAVMEAKVQDIQQKFPLNSFQCLLWDQQLKAARSHRCSSGFYQSRRNRHTPFCFPTTTRQ